MASLPVEGETDVRWVRHYTGRGARTIAGRLAGKTKLGLLSQQPSPQRGFSIERLMMMLTAFGRDVEVVVRPVAKAGKKGGMRLRRAVA